MPTTLSPPAAPAAADARAAPARFETAAPLRFVVNAASGRHDRDETEKRIADALAAAGRAGQVDFAPKGTLAEVAARAASAAAADGGAIVAVGGDGTINAVANAAWDAGCVLGVVPQGTFNYFARTHGIPTDPDAALAALLAASPRAVQVGRVNGHVFLVNASLGLYPDLLEDREAWKSRFGRSRLVAFGAALATLAGEHRRLRLAVELGGKTQLVRTQTLFVGNNRLQFEQVGLPQARAIEHGRIGAVMLKPLGSWRLLGLLLRGAIGRLGEADTVESFAFERMVVRPWLPAGTRIKLAYDGEVVRVRAPVVFEVAPRPLVLLLSPAAA
ncbi:diacylglycerol/lipid kinase family protein [Rubrivivax gelatinosus]|uniref:diacylglycerol/lipid kinase family protein n=1 Tax=Rubrivivax gelatinosus TaxID=28068 RepID=UPI001F5B7137|nr:diacylglycerol kinase family protein [Rubrivivax gelatinosus]